MISPATSSRVPYPGDTGWTAEALSEPAAERAWHENRWELVRGVIAEMPAAHFSHGFPVQELFDLIRGYYKANGQRVFLSTEADLVFSEATIYRPDGVVLTADEVVRQKQAQLEHGQSDDGVNQLFIPPTLVIESISSGHERHDRELKRADYAKFGIPNYWLVNFGAKSLECLRLEAGQYVEDAVGQGDDQVKPSAFPGLIIPLNKVFSL